MDHQNQQVHGALSLHVGDLLMVGDDVFDKKTWAGYEVPSWLRR